MVFALQGNDRSLESGSAKWERDCWTFTHQKTCLTVCDVDKNLSFRILNHNKSVLLLSCPGKSTVQANGKFGSGFGRVSSSSWVATTDVNREILVDEQGPWNSGSCNSCKIKIVQQPGSWSLITTHLGKLRSFRKNYGSVTFSQPAIWDPSTPLFQSAPKQSCLWEFTTEFLSSTETLSWRLGRNSEFQAKSWMVWTRGL